MAAANHVITVTEGRAMGFIATEDMLAMPPENTIKLLEQELEACPSCPCCGEGYSKPREPAMSGYFAPAKLMVRPWFSRLWVVQEIFSAGERHVDVVVGRHRTSWLSFRDADTASQVFKYGHIVYSTFAYKHDAFRVSGAINMMLYCMNRQCLDARDRIFALHSILHFRTIGLLPDYTRDTGEVYLDFVVSCMRHIRSNRTSDNVLAFLILVGTESGLPDRPCDGTYARPSWVPDFNRLSNVSTKKLKMHSSTSKPGLHQWRLTPLDRDVFQIRGHFFASIDSILEQFVWPELPKTVDEASTRQYSKRSEVLKRRLEDYWEREPTNTISFDDSMDNFLSFYFDRNNDRMDFERRLARIKGPGLVDVA
ncbi:Uu.00g093360.m01.CDS01 [Anthostomella pinea]|uniref:Uu.00g093360.m01.CDS01 n=1 Tax=Anthostomella pinea TaxID=933095 RepID=A0AAI8VNG5_9PEZI|nr:Uu.00g093360.m01.CDS01 [Anthostomella pinea]